MKARAIELISLIEKKDAEYQKVNTTMREIQGDFSSHIEIINTDIYSGITDLLDEILGDELASYYLFECSTMKEGGAIVENKKEYKLRNIEDLKAYVYRNTAN